MVVLPWVNTMIILTLEEAAWSPGGAKSTAVVSWRFGMLFISPSSRKFDTEKEQRLSSRV